MDYKPALNGDHTIRVVHARNLAAMCKRASGMSHVYSLDIGKTRAVVTYSNPDEYGNAAPYSMRFPVAPDGAGSHWVYLDMASETGGRDEYDREAASQSIRAEIMDAAPLWCNPRNGGAWEPEARAPMLPRFADGALRLALVALERAAADGWEDATTGELGAALREVRISLGLPADKPAPRWTVHVGNVGEVHSGTKEAEARAAYAQWVERSKEGGGRSAGEPVTLCHAGEPIAEHSGTNAEE